MIIKETFKDTDKNLVDILIEYLNEVLLNENKWKFIK